MRRDEMMTNESDFQTACGWWSDLPNIWTPVGWEGHLFRFSLLWDGTIIAPPHLNRRTEAWRDQGVQVACRPIMGPCPGDDGWNNQGWNTGAVPVLWTEKFTPEGILYRQEVFAHVLGGQAIARGDEPLFAWIRLSLADMVTALPLEDETGFSAPLAVHTPPLAELKVLRINGRECDILQPQTVLPGV